MAVDTPNVKIDPYTSQVPLIQIPRDELQKNPEPAANYMGKAGGIAEIANAGLKGVLRGLQQKEEKKYATATATINALDKTTESSYQQYQEALAQGKDKAATDAAYAVYLKQFNDSKAAKSQFVIPQKPAKGADKSKRKDQNQPATGGFGASLKQFFERNPHVIPELALAAMQPKPPGASTDTVETKNRLQEQQNTLTTQGQTIEDNKNRLAQEQRQQTLEVQKQKVDEAGGANAVLQNKDAPPEMQQVARRIQAEALDKESPEGQLRVQMEQDVLGGKDKNWTPGQRQLAGAWGLAPQPKPVTVMGKNGHQQEILVDPTTNQPIPGSKPLDLGPPAWAQEFYAKRAADRNDIKSAVAQNPANYGLSLTGDKKTDDAKIAAVTARLYVEAEQGIKAASAMTGKTGFEVQRDDGWLKDTLNSMQIEDKVKQGASPFDNPKEVITYPGGKQVPLNRAAVKQIFDEFSSWDQGIRSFRDTPSNPGNKSAQELEVDRQWLKKYVENRGEVLKGKSNIPGQSAEAILKSTALGRPIPANAGGNTGGNISKPSFMDKVEGFFHIGDNKPENVGGGMAKPEAAAPQMSFGNEAFSGSKQWKITDAAGNSMGYNMTDQQANYMKQQGYTVEPAQ